MCFLVGHSSQVLILRKEFPFLFFRQDCACSSRLCTSAFPNWSSIQMSFSGTIMVYKIMGKSITGILILKFIFGGWTLEFLSCIASVRNLWREMEWLLCCGADPNRRFLANSHWNLHEISNCVNLLSSPVQLPRWSISTGKSLSIILWGCILSLLTQMFLSTRKIWFLRDSPNVNMVWLEWNQGLVKSHCWQWSVYILFFKNLITKLLNCVDSSACMWTFLGNQVLQIVLWNGNHVSHLLLQPSSHTQVSAWKEKRLKASDFMDPVDCQ